MFYKILVALDRSEIGKYVFDEALSLAKAIRASLMLLHVLSPYEEGYPPNMPLVSNLNYSKMQEEDLKRYLEQLQVFKDQGLNLLQSRTDEATAAGVNTEFIQTPGTPGYVICGLARTWGADLILMGRRGHSSLSELILGSVSNYVTHHAPCSVLVVHRQIHIRETEPEDSQVASFDVLANSTTYPVAQN